MRPLIFTLNIMLDGCYDHTMGIPDAEMHHHHADNLARVDALLIGRVTYQMMEAAWRPPGMLAQMPEWTMPFARTIDKAKKYVVSTTLSSVDWNAELVQGDLETAVRALKDQPGNSIGVGGVKLAFALTELGLIDEYEFLVHPRITGRGPTLFAGLSKVIDLRLVGRKELASGAVALRYQRAA